MSTTKTAPQTQSSSAIAKLNPHICSDTFNVKRQSKCPTATVVNQADAGIFLSESLLLESVWTSNHPRKEMRITQTAPKPDKGILLTKVRLAVIGVLPPYLRFKSRQEPGSEHLAKQFFDRYSKEIHDKKMMDTVGDYLVMFLDENNKPYHIKPIIVKFRNVSYWRFQGTLDEIYTAAEKSFSLVMEQPYSSKSDKWRALAVAEMIFEGQLVGEGNNKSYCCVVKDFTPSTQTTFFDYFLSGEEESNHIWSLVDAYECFSPYHEILTTPKTTVLPPSEEVNEEGLRRVEAVIDDEDVEDDLVGYVEGEPPY